MEPVSLRFTVTRFKYMYPVVIRIMTAGHERNISTTYTDYHRPTCYDHRLPVEYHIAGEIPSTSNKLPIINPVQRYQNRQHPLDDSGQAGHRKHQLFRRRVLLYKVELSIASSP